MMDFSSRMYGSKSPPWLNLLGYAGVVVTGAMLRLNGLGLIKMYILGNIAAPAHPLPADCGHEIFLGAFVKWIPRARMLKKLLGHGLRLGVFANCICTASYVIILSIVSSWLYHYEASSDGVGWGESCLFVLPTVCSCIPFKSFLGV